MSGSLSVRRVFGDRPFAEIGMPSAVVADEGRELVAVGGDLGYLQWSGDSAAIRRWVQYRVGMYGAQDLRCRWVVKSRWPVHSMAFHPTLAVLAVGTGSYDGGYSFEGELLIVNLESGHSTPVLRWEREVLHVEWESDQALRVIVAPPDDYDYEQAHTRGFSAVVERSDWSRVTDASVQGEELNGPSVEFERPPVRAADASSIELLAALAEEPWEPRRLVWDVQELSDGRVLACGDGVLAEAWLPDGHLQWRVADAEGGRQLVVRADGLDAWVNVERHGRWTGSEWVKEPPFVARVSLDDGKELSGLHPDTSVTLTTCASGWVALRSTNHDRDRGLFALLPPKGETADTYVPLGGFDLFNHPFPIRHATRLLFLEGKEGEPSQDKRVIAIDPVDDDGEPARRELFPLEWDTERRGHLFGGPGIEVGSAENRDLVHAGAVHDGRGLLPGNAFVVRRSLADGAMRWVFTADFPVTALDGDENTVYIAFNSGEVVALRTSDGIVRWRQHLAVHGQPTTPLSLTHTAPGNLLIGTADGRILSCSVA